MPPGNRIRADITANPKGFIAGVNKATRHLDQASRRWQKAFVGIASAGAFGAGIRVLDDLGKAAIRSGDSIGKAAKTAGIGAEALQEYRFAAKLAGNTQKELDAALGRFTRRLGEARRGNKAYADTFAELGVEVTDTNEQALKKIFNTLGDVKDITIRTSLATKVFGDDARRMALLVSDGADELDRMRQKARDTGSVLSSELVVSLEEANDKLQIMESQRLTKLNKTVAENIDGFISFKERLNDVSLAAVETAGFIGKLSEKFRVLDDRNPSKPLREGAATEDLLERQKKVGILIDDTKKLISAFEDAPFPFNGKGSALNLELLDQRLDELKTQSAEINRLTLSNVQSALAKPVKDDGVEKAPTPVAGFRISNVPTLKSEALAKRAKKAGDEIARIIDATRPPLQALELKLQAIEALRPFAQSSEEAEALKLAANAVGKEIDELTGKTIDWRQESERALSSITDAFADAAIFGDDLGRTLSNITKQLGSRLLSNFLFNSASALIPGGSGFDGLFGGARALGGPVSPGKSFLVGEEGPEMFKPSVGGTIVPNSALSGASIKVEVVNHFDVGLESVDDRIKQVTPAIAASVVDAVDRARNRPSFA